jgi:hypothetical protein
MGPEAILAFPIEVQQKIGRGFPKVTADTWFFLRAGAAPTGRRSLANGFLVQKCSAALRNGTPLKNRDWDTKRGSLRSGIPVSDIAPELYCFDRNSICNSASQAGEIIKDGHCSGSQIWREPKTNRTRGECIGGHA